jgi:MFS family permease
VSSTDDQIVKAFSLVSLLLAFTAAYFAALWPIISDLLNSPSPETLAERRAAGRRCRSYAISMLVFAVILALIAALLTPLTLHVLDDLGSQVGFDTVRAGLLLVQVFQIAGLVTGLVLFTRLRRRAGTLTEPSH